MRVVLLAFCLIAVSAGQQTATKADPNLAEAVAHLERKDYQSAIRSLELAVQAAAHSNPEIYVLLATAHLNLKEPEAAFEACWRGLQAVPGSPQLERYYVSLVLTLSRPEERAPRFEEALQSAPDSPYFQLALGRVLAEADWHNNRAEDLLRAAARKLPKDPEARYRYADWLCSHEKNELCVTEISAALALDQTNLVAQMQGLAYLGNAQDGLDHPAAAERAYKRSQEFNARLGWPNRRISAYYARFLLGQGRTEEAERILNELVQRAPDCGPAHRELARLYVNTGRLQQAIDEGRLALSYPQGSLEDERAVHLNLIKAYYLLGRNEEAEQHRQWVKDHPN